MRSAQGREAGLESGLVFLGLIQCDTLTLVHVLIEKVVGIVQLFQCSSGEHGLQSFPQGHHIMRSHRKCRNQFWMILQSITSHGSNWMKLGQFSLDFAILSFLLGHNVSLQINESCVMLLENDAILLFRCINDGCLFVLVQDACKPILKLHCIADGCTECQHRTVACLDDSLKRITFGSVEGVYLVKNKVIELVETSVENHEFTLSLGHFVSGNTTDFGQASFEGHRGSDVNLGITGNFLEGNLFRTDGDISLEELVVNGGNLPHQNLTGKDKEDGTVRVFTGVRTKNGFTRRGRSANNRRFSVVDRLQNIKLPGFELEFAVVSTERRETVRHLGQLERNKIFLAAHELASILERISVRPTVVTAVLVQTLESSSVGAQNNLHGL
mmetsp:Transcript_1020/g.2257  ORF Transcript_1020/g.2257 Transcript_1020/m.2257 type:complete len:385 (-) Transcript_1020:504-1658(-)